MCLLLIRGSRWYGTGSLGSLLTAEGEEVFLFKHVSIAKEVHLVTRQWRQHCVRGLVGVLSHPSSPHPSGGLFLKFAARRWICVWELPACAPSLWQELGEGHLDGMPPQAPPVGVVPGTSNWFRSSQNPQHAAGIIYLIWLREHHGVTCRSRREQQCQLFSVVSCHRRRKRMH